MNRFLVLQRNNSEHSTVQFINFAPKSETVLLLWFDLYWFHTNSNAPVFLNVRTLPQDLIFKVLSELIFLHNDSVQP